jgi:hypothetical protein
MEKKVKVQNDSLFQRTFENVDKSGLYQDRSKFNEKESCDRGKRNEEAKGVELRSGYDALRDNSFYLQPQLKNTFHNYPVRQEDGMYCSENHQLFNNMTRRKVQFKPEESNTDLSNIIKEDVPKDLKISPCKILNKK